MEQQIEDGEIAPADSAFVQQEQEETVPLTPEQLLQ